MDIKQLKKELGLKDKYLAEFLWLYQRCSAVHLIIDNIEIPLPNT